MVQTSPSAQVWVIAAPTGLWSLAYRAWSGLMVMLALVWLWQFGQSVTSANGISWGHGLAACTLLCWLLLAWRVFRRPSPPQDELTLLWSAAPSSHQSPWTTPQGDAVQVHVLMDWGRHLLLCIRVHATAAGSARVAVRAQQASSRVYFRWVSEAELSGPWRWRVHAWHHPHP